MLSDITFSEQNVKVVNFFSEMRLFFPAVFENATFFSGRSKYILFFFQQNLLHFKVNWNAISFENLVFLGDSTRRLNFEL